MTTYRITRGPAATRMDVIGGGGIIGGGGLTGGGGIIGGGGGLTDA